MPVFDKAVTFMTAQYREHLKKNPHPVFIFGECEDPEYDAEHQLMEDIFITVVKTTDWHRILLLAHGFRMNRDPDYETPPYGSEHQGQDIVAALLSREKGPTGLLPTLAKEDPIAAVRAAAAEMIDRVEGMAEEGNK